MLRATPIEYVVMLLLIILVAILSIVAIPMPR